MNIKRLVAFAMLAIAVLSLGGQAMAQENATVAKGINPVRVTTSCDSTFTDVPAGSRYYTATHYLATQGYMCGNPVAPTTWGINVDTTKLEIAKVAFLISQLTPYTYTTNVFNDVSLTSNSRTYVETLYHNEVFNWVGRYDYSNYDYDLCVNPYLPCDANFRPYFLHLMGNYLQDVTREFALKTIVRPDWTMYYEPPQQFHDVILYQMGYEELSVAHWAGLYPGYPCGGVGEPCDANNLPYFRPNNTETRGELALMAYNREFGYPHFP